MRPCTCMLCAVYMWLWSRTRGTYATHGMHGTAQWRSVRMRVSAVRPRVVILRGTHTDTCPPSLIWDSIERAPRLQQKIPSQLANHHPGPGMHPPYGMASLIYGARSSHYVPLQPYRTLRLQSSSEIHLATVAGRPASSHARLRSLEE